nr:serine hydrolase [uncultured Actinoplanes sp.]
MLQRRLSIAAAYRKGRDAAGGVWRAYLTDADGPIVEDDPDRLAQGYSVQKLAVATAVLDKVDRGELSVGQLLEVTESDVLGGSGLYHLQGVWGDRITLAGALTAMLLVSDNTAVRLCGRVCPAAEINDILAAKGFRQTRVEPVADPHRFRMGTTTPRETHDLLRRLAGGTLLGPRSSEFLLRVLRSAGGYTDGVRRNMSSAERARIATKHGADVNSLGAARHEAGIVFDRQGKPAIAYAVFADELPGRDNYGATHPAVQAHAAIGRAMLDAVTG